MEKWYMFTAKVTGILEVIIVVIWELRLQWEVQKVKHAFTF